MNLMLWRVSIPMYTVFLVPWLYVSRYRYVCAEFQVALASLIQWSAFTLKYEASVLSRRSFVHLSVDRTRLFVDKPVW